MIAALRRMRATVTLASLGAMACAMVASLVCLWRVTPITGLLLVFLGVPLFAVGLAGLLFVLVAELRDRGAL